ncbi:MAG: hypothetical protein IEMM0008_1134 [bacterium]|nr:MAG: hypothetical protein IEMM0008_1134 [bacterium]
MKVYMTAILSILMFCMTQPAFADYWNQRNFLMGERAAMMGGAYTALSEDISGTFYNPAGLAFVEETSISMASSVYQYSNYQRTDVRASVSSDLKGNYERFNLVPSTFGINYVLGDGMNIAVSIYQLDNCEFDSLNASSTRILKFNLRSQSYLIGPTLAVRIGDDMAFGISVFYHYVQSGVSITDDRVTGPGQSRTAQFQLQATSGGITPVIGFKWYMTDRWQLGIMYGVQTIHTNGSSSFARTFTSTAGNTPPKNLQSEGDFRLPHRMTVGLAYEIKKHFTLALDVLYYFKLNYPSDQDFNSTSSTIQGSYVEKAHFNVSLGGEIYLSKKMALRFGFFTNTSSASDKDASERVDVYGFTTGIGYISKGLSSGIGVITSYGESDTQFSQVGSGARWKRLNVGLIFGGTIRFGSGK